MQVVERSRAEAWFVELYPLLTETAYETHPGLLVFDCHNILDQLAKRLPRFQGETREDFMAWAGEFIRRRAAQVARTECILAECKRIMCAAVHRNWPTHTVDYAVSDEDFYSDVAKLIHILAEKLDQPGKAKTSTRVFTLAKTHMRHANTRRNRRLVRMAQHLALGGEVTGAIPPEELAAEKYSEAAASCS